MTEISSVNATPQTKCVCETCTDTPKCVPAKIPDLPNDSVDLSCNKKIPDIGFFRIALNRLTPEQIAMVNESGKLPGNAKFVRNPMTGEYQINNNILGWTQGTRTLPAGYEVRRNVLGFTTVLPKDTEGLFIKSKED